MNTTPAEGLLEAETLNLTVIRKKKVADGIFLFEFRRPDGSDLPVFEAGAHLLVRTPSGSLRRYSLCNSPTERYRYLIGVKRDLSGEGGSVSMTDDLAVGDMVKTSVPVNYFPLSLEGDSHLLIAGGIGITPILAMARHLQAVGQHYQLVYCARSVDTAAFVDVLGRPEFEDRVTLHFDGGDSSRVLDFEKLLAERPPGAHIYCCGPRPLMQAVRDAARHWPSGAVHFEDFGTSAQPNADTERVFKVRLARRGEVVEVPPGISILEALRRRGIEVPSSCEAGTCASCRTGLLAGIADHRDFVLDEDEWDSAIMICVSRAKSEELTLDV